MNMEAITDMTCTKCGKRKAIKLDHKGRPRCNHCYHGIVDPIRKGGKRLGRNMKCFCGSGKKYKNCCKGKAVFDGR